MSKTRRLGLGGVAGLVICAGAAAQTDGATPLERQTDEAFRQVLQQPQDLSLWSKYAQFLVQAGNYEGGIAALERLLLNPDASPELRVDIASLYFRLGSYAMSEAMLGQALADSRLQGEKLGFAQALLAEVKKRNQRSQWSGALVLGLRHQTNSMYRTDSVQVLSGGVLGPVPANQAPRSDNDINVGLRFQHAYDLERQNSATIVTGFGAYLADYRSSSGSQLTATPTTPYDLLVLDLNTGVRFKPAPDTLSGLTIRPHVIFSNVTAQGHQYLRNQGLGLDLTWRQSEKTQYTFTLDGQDRTFANRIDVPAANQLNGRLYSLRGRVSHEVRPGQVLIAEGGFSSNRAGQGIYDFDSREFRVTYSMSYASPVSKGQYWTTSVWLGGLNRTYGAADPSVSPTQTHKDREWRLGVGHSMPLAPSWSLLLSLEHTRNQANLPNFRYKNTTLSGAVVRSF
ncbi:MAG: surface lipoprotein assembly modifier [Ramlibacter sp.]